MDIQTYYEDRLELLKQLQKVNEDFLSSVESWESYEGHLNDRDELIAAVRDLDENFGRDKRKLLDEEKTREMDNILRLILALDRDITEALNRERRETLEAMKVTTRGKKLAGYGFGHGSSHGESQGKVLNTKE